MDNNQSTDSQGAQHSSALSYSQPAQSSQHLGQSARKNFLPELIRHSPWLVLIGVWSFLAAVITIAFFSITQVSNLKQEEPEPTPVETASPNTFQTRNSRPWWLLGTVTLIGAASSIIVAKWVKSSSGLPKLRQRIKFTAKRKLTRRQQRKLLQGKQPSFTSLPIVPLPAKTEPEITVLQPEENQSLQSSESLVEKIPPVEEKQLLNLEQLHAVTVLPPENNTLNSGEESLAEKMDIRKHLSLSAILGETYPERGVRKE
ncbi:hypothetical protein [Chroococcidiopsis sp. CCMEE 29]|uniref:hypothetical protein n=1 Tax=Chroococcidiopsis sp. CCMEE 29 TaxID=155894 RepID=UPI0020216A95|nr:hypothetical protein [Chroococcidiopsis sp. CCMEE 29]